MDYVALCKKYFPDVEVVCDFTKGRFSHISLEERNLMPQKELQKLIKAEHEEFSASRDPSCFGGSDIACILGRGYTPPSLLARKKLGQYKEVITPEKQELFDAGHRAEPMIRQAFERVSGIRAIEWPITMVNPKYPRFRMNIDGLCFENGKIGIYEGKWSEVWTVYNPYYEKARKFINKGLPAPLVCCPEKYLYQVWGYQAGLDLDFGYLCGGWGYSDCHIGYIRIPRLPKDKEEWLMQTCDEFMQLVNAGNIPSDVDFQNKGKLLELYAEMACQIPKRGTEKNFSRTDAAAAREYLRLEAEIQALDAQAKEYRKKLFEENGVSQKKVDMEAIEAYFTGELMDEYHGTATDADGSFEISYEKTKGSKSFLKDVCREKYPEIFDEVYGYPEKRKLTIKEKEESR